MPKSDDGDKRDEKAEGEGDYIFPDFDDDDDGDDEIDTTPRGAKFARKGIWIAVLIGAAFGARVGAKFPSRVMVPVMAVGGALAVAIVLLLLGQSPEKKEKDNKGMRK